jgi:tRNA modification GTPase
MVEAGDTKEHINHLLEGLRVKPEFNSKQMVLLLNKLDLIQDKLQPYRYGKHDFSPLRENDHLIEVSAKTGSGLDRLRSLLVSVIQEDKPGENDTVVTNLRHYEALRNARDAVLRAAGGLENGLPGDLLAMDIREVLHYLGEITGEITTDEILGNIFKNFCIGK